MCALLVEVFRHMLAPDHLSKAAGLWLLRWVGPAFLAIAVLTTAEDFSHHSFPDITLILTVERGVKVMQCAMLILVFLLSSFFALPWRHYCFGIAAGLGVLVSMDLMTASTRAQLGMSADLAYRLWKPAAYNLAVSIWTIYLIKAPAALPVLRTIARLDLRPWNQTLTEFWQK